MTKSDKTWLKMTKKVYLKLVAGGHDADRHVVLGRELDWVGDIRLGSKKKISFLILWKIVQFNLCSICDNVFYSFLN